MANVSGLNIVSPRYPMKGSPMDARELDKIGAKGPLREYLARLAFSDQVAFFDDFLGDTINTDLYVATASGAASAAPAVPGTQIVSGAITMDSGTDDNGYAHLIGPLAFKGDQNAGMQIRLRTTDPTLYSIEAGFIDAAANGGMVNNLDTPTSSATDGACVVLDTDTATQKALCFLTAGTSFTTTKTALATTNLTLNTYMVIRIQLVGNAAYCWINGTLQASHTGDKVEGGTLLAPWVYLRTNVVTANKVATVDYIATWQDRV